MEVDNYKSQEGSGYPTVGYFPKSIPRDPIEIDTFLEHVLLGQVLDTVITTDEYGKIKSGLAKTWFFSKEGKEIVFNLREGVKFSNGKELDSKDVVYSLNRHFKNTHSQSNEYLSSVKEIIVIDKLSFKITLTKRRVSLIKVLSRDQLGIVPNNWKLLKNEETPYIGTGPYILKRDSKGWILSKNPFSLAHDDKTVPTWRILTGNINEELSSNLPTYLPFFAGISKDILTKNYPNLEENIQNQVSYVQSSLWWNPNGLNFKDDNFKKLSMSLLTKLINHLKKDKIQSTGVIPDGILGHLSKEIKPNIVEGSEIKRLRKNLKKSEIRISVPAHLYNEYFNNNEKIKNLEDQYGLKLNIRRTDFIKRHEQNKIFKPDIIIARWAGGFNDPEGFLAILDKELDTELEDYLGKSAKYFIHAKVEDTSQKRSDLFQQMGKGIIEDQLMIPAWKTQIFYFLNSSYEINKTTYRYTPRFIDVKSK